MIQGQVVGGFKCNTVEAYNNPAVMTLGLRSQQDWTKPVSFKSQMTFVCSTSLSSIKRPPSFIDWQALLVSILLCFWSNIQCNHQLSTVTHTKHTAILWVYVQLQRAHFLAVELGNKRKLSTWIFGSGDTTIIKMHKHKLLCFAADMEMLPINCSFHSASLGRTKDNQTFCGTGNFKPPNQGEP